jgi:hypothetical protein
MSESGNDGKKSDMREFSRIDHQCMVSYREKGTRDYDVAQTRNVSVGGMYLRTGMAYASGTLLELLVRFPFFNQRVPVTGIVITSRGDAPGFGTSIRFLDLNQGIARQLEAYIDTHRQK